MSGPVGRRWPGRSRCGPGSAASPSARDVLLRGEAGWGEWSPFLEYPPEEVEPWLRCAEEAAAGDWPDPRAATGSRSTSPCPRSTPSAPTRSSAPAGARPPRSRSPSRASAWPTTWPGWRRCGTRWARQGRIRVDANGGWLVDEAVAAIRALDRAAGGLEYVEQPCATVEELAAVRRAVDVPVAADESIRRAADPYRVRDLEAADIAVLKVQPLGGVRACLRIAEDIGLPVVVSSALETSVGIAAGVALAAALPELPYACGLATVQLLTDDVATAPLLPVDGCLPVAAPQVDADALPPARGRAGAGRALGAAAGRGPGAAAGSTLVTNPSTALGRAVVDALVEHGVTEIVVAPGSRNAPLLFAAYDAAEVGLVRLHTRIDERTAGYLALGLAKVVAPAGRGRLHLGDRGRQPASGDARGGPRGRPARRRHRRPAGPAARHRRQPDHRPGRHLRPAGPPAGPRRRRPGDCRARPRPLARGPRAARPAGAAGPVPRQRRPERPADARRPLVPGAAERPRAGGRPPLRRPARDRSPRCRSVRAPWWSPATTRGRRPGRWRSGPAGRCSPSRPAGRAPATTPCAATGCCSTASSAGRSSGSWSAATRPCPAR